MKISSAFLICIPLILLATPGSGQWTTMDFLVGTWKMKDKEQFEVWEKTGRNELSGYSYRISQTEKVILETLSIKKIGDQIIYEATVPDQNEGRTIPFPLNTELKDYFSFENERHDFPKKIQYRQTSKNSVQVSVLGADGQGFSYELLRQE